MSVERNLISKILNERDMAVVSEAGVSPEYFHNHENREAFQYILDHKREYAEVPSVEAFHRHYPTYKVAEAPDSLSFYVDEISHDYTSFLLEDALVLATDQFEDGDIDTAKQTLAQCLMTVNRETTRTVATDLTENPEERIERYKTYRLSQGALKGISTGFSLIDYATSGMQPGQLFTFVGPPKAGKSTMLLLSAMFASMGYHRPLFIGFEMSNSEQEERHDAIRAGVSHTRLRDGRLNAEEMRKVEKMGRRLESMPPLIFTSDATSSSTLSGIAGLIDKYDPDVVYVDGVYMLDDENGETKGSPQALTNITRGLKRMAQNRDIPIAISTQVLAWKMDRNRGVTTASIGYASSFAQDSDVLIGVEPTEEPNTNKVKILDGRNVKRMEFYVKWDWETGEFEEMEDVDEEVEDEEAETKF